MQNILSQRNEVKVIASEYKLYSFRILDVVSRYLFINKKAFDYIFIGFLAQPLFSILYYFTKKPIICDIFISLYDTLCFDRKKLSANSFLGKFACWLDYFCCKKSIMLITDTNAHSLYFQESFSCNPSKIRVVYLSVEKNIFYPRDENLPPQNNKFNIFYYGSVLPLHGIEYILKAAKLLENDRKIFFTLIGPIEKYYKHLLGQLYLINTDFVPWVPYAVLPEYISKADLCLGGPFGITDKAKRVIAGKSYQFATMKKPIILGDNVANHEIFTHEQNCIMVKMGDEQSLAHAIQQLKQDEILRKKISEEAYKAVEKMNNYSLFYKQ